jgi:hypothetical protein
VYPYSIECYVVPGPATLFERGRCRHMPHSSGSRLFVWEGSGTTMRLVALDFDSLLERVPEPPHVLTIRTCGQMTLS